MRFLSLVMSFPFARVTRSLRGSKEKKALQGLASLFKFSWQSIGHGAPFGGLCDLQFLKEENAQAVSSFALSYQDHSLCLYEIPSLKSVEIHTARITFRIPLNFIGPRCFSSIEECGDFSAEQVVDFKAHELSSA